MHLPNLIIGGTGRSGSTSLFRYLADHPEVCGSSRKETQFFIRHIGNITSRELEKYSGFFSHCNASHKIRIEATPHYLQFADRIAPSIHAALPGVKLAFILREPASRLFTGFRNLRLLESKNFGAWSFDEFVSHAINHQSQANNNSDDPRLRAAYYMHTGCYSEYLSKYLKIFGPENICILFFDHLVSMPKSVMIRLAEFLAIDEKFYDDYTFTRENRTRAYRSRLIHITAHSINQLIEPALNRLPSARKLIRGAYNLVNEADMQKESPSEAAMTALNEFYHPHNAKLRRLLEKHGYIDDIPAWLAKEKQPTITEQCSTGQSR
ncbi:sulfotransferase family protein [Thiohalobacter thiocyanaticus]|uniref:Uncharacterized protein n=1 Tax=Thiohalobacter thiocyanaticus TaxID=585455 RepID=A0A426QIS4_9GAMM|nr:sulfotransferase [Thiohalobacter thiocyanaticus]RRQ21640.1 hypothetical protein D6C00_06555 [Thiohalobacter thiocyanaticus]